MFHAGDGNLHPLVCYDAARRGRARARREAGRADRQGLRRRRRLDHRRARRRRRQEGATCRRCSRETDLDAFHRLRCAFDPARPGQPRQGDADPAAVRRGPGALPRASARARRRRRAVLTMADAARAPDLRGGRRVRSPARPPRISRCASGARAPSSAGARRPRRPSSSCGARRLDPAARAQRRRPDRDPRGRRSAGAAPRRCSPAPVRCSRSTRSCGPRVGDRSADDRRGHRHRRLGTAAPPLRRAPRSRARDDGRPQRRDDRPLGRQGDQERRRLRPGQAVLGFVRHAWG